MRLKLLQLSSARSPMRAALIAGFAVVFALWLVSGYELVRNIRDVEQRMAAARQTFLRGEEALTKVSTNVLLGSIYLRDALMTPTTEVRQHSRQELLRLRAAVDRALADYLSLVDAPLEREQAARLQVELDAYWNHRTSRAARAST